MRFTTQAPNNFMASTSTLICDVCNKHIDTGAGNWPAHSDDWFLLRIPKAQLGKSKCYDVCGWACLCALVMKASELEDSQSAIHEIQKQRKKLGQSFTLSELLIGLGATKNKRQIPDRRNCRKHD